MIHRLHSLSTLSMVFAGCLIMLFTNHRAISASRESPQQGAAVFRARGCEQCHSITGIGGDRGPDLGSVGLRRDPARIKAQILNGGHGMPPFGKLLSREEAKSLTAFLVTCRSDTAPGCRQWMPAP